MAGRWGSSLLRDLILRDRVKDHEERIRALEERIAKEQTTPDEGRTSATPAGSATVEQVQVVCRMRERIVQLVPLSDAPVVIRCPHRYFDVETIPDGRRVRIAMCAKLRQTEAHPYCEWMEPEYL